MIFDLFVAPEQRKMGGPQGPPPAPGKAFRTSPLLGLSFGVHPDTLPLDTLYYLILQRGICLLGTARHTQYRHGTQILLLSLTKYRFVTCRLMILMICSNNPINPSEPPYLAWLWSQILSKNHVPLNGGINSNSFEPFS